jgi:hypothetical protein
MHRPRCGPSRLKCLVAVLVLLGVARVAPALIMVGRGNAPVNDAGWPSGAVDVANLKSRVGWYEGPPFGGGESVFLYRGDMQALNEALKALAAVRSAAPVQIVLHDGPQHSPFLRDDKDKGADTRYDWSFTVWVPQNWHKVFNDPRTTFMADQPNFRQPVAAPRIDVYLTPKIDWKRVSVPDGVAVVDGRVGGERAAQGATIRADVFDMASGKPVPGAQLVVETQKPAPQGGGAERGHGQPAWEVAATAAGDKLGRVELANIPAGRGRVVASAPGYAPRLIQHEVFRDGSARRLTIELAAVAKLTGTVVDENGKPLAGVSVRTSNVMGIDGRGYNSPARPETTADEKGAFTLDGLPRGYAQVWAHAKGRFHTDGLKLFEVPVQRPLTVQLVATGVLKGRVVDGKGKPAGGGTVHVTPPGEQIGKWGGSMNVKPDGSWQFDEVPPGPYTVSTKPMHAGMPADPNAQEVTIASGKETEVELKQ